MVSCGGVKRYQHRGVHLEQQHPHSTGQIPQRVTASTAPEPPCFGQGSVGARENTHPPAREVFELPLEWRGRVVPPKPSLPIHRTAPQESPGTIRLT